MDMPFNYRTIFTFGLVFSLLLSVHGLAQQETPNGIGTASIKMIARSYEDSVVLRWAPSTALAWSALNRTGYNIYRLDLENPSAAQHELLTPQPLKPLSLQVMKQRLSADNQMAAVAAQAIHGTTFVPSGRGGLAGSIADQADMLSNRYAFTLMAADYDAPTARAIALGFVDKTVKPGRSYIYKITPAGVLPGLRVDSGAVLVRTVKDDPIEKPTGLVAVAADRVSELHWHRYQEGGFGGYFIERSRDGRNFQVLNAVPYFSSLPDSSLLQDSAVAHFKEVLLANHIYIDSLTENYRDYYYRIRGIDAFAELSPYSDVVKVSGMDMSPPSPPTLKPGEITGHRTVKLSWEKNEIENDLSGYYIHRSKNINGPYEPITPNLLSPNRSSFIDTGAYEHGAGFYMIVARDTAGNYANSLPVMVVMPDSIPPQPPTGLQGRIDRRGMVYVSWQPNREEDVMSYKVYVANQEDHLFAQVPYSESINTSFEDSITLETLSKDIYYRVVAVDYNNNHSQYSEILKLRKPDIIPPVAPVFRSLKVGPGGVEIDVIQSSSTDVTAYSIFRKEGQDEWKRVSGVKHDASRESFLFTDTTIQPGKRYFFAARAIDEDSLQSEMSAPYPVQLNTFPPQPAIADLKAKYDDSKKAVILSWSYADKGDYFFILYRGEGDAPMELYQSLDKSDRTFTDTQLSPGGKTYRYAIMARFKDGRQDTKLSASVEAGIPSIR